MAAFIDATAAAEELIRRRRIRGSLTEWARYKGFEPAAHHRLIICEIEEFLASSDEVLLLFAPPGSAKSTYVSRLLPSWYLANHPHDWILAVTHSDEFADQWGAQVRDDIVLDARVLGIAVSPESRAAGLWRLRTGAKYYGTGARVGISGFRADLGIIDDIFGKRDDAWSPTVRRQRWNFYVNDFSPRLKPHAKRIMINTRWHEEDVAGMVLGQIERGEVKGRVVSIRAIAEDDDPLGRRRGEYLWDEPKGYDYGKYLRDRQRETTPMMWAALYQQRPAPEEGDYFKVGWINRVPRSAIPARELMQVYGGSDYAVTSDGGDYTVHVVVGLDPEGEMYLLDVWREQASTDVWVEAWADLVKRWKPLDWAEEGGQINSSVGPFLEMRARERKAWVARTQFPPRHDKAVRAQSIRGRMAMQGLNVPDDAEWVDEFVSELLHFPAGKHDDQVDALGLIGQLLDKVVYGTKPVVPERKKATDYKPVSDRGEGGGYVTL